MTTLTINTSTDTKHNLNFSSRQLSVGTVTNGTTTAVQLVQAVLA
jgi:hypothetical protein